MHTHRYSGTFAQRLARLLLVATIGLLAAQTQAAPAASLTSTQVTDPALIAFIDPDLPDAQVLQAASARTAPGVFQLFSHGKPGQLLINGQWLAPQAIAAWLSQNGLLTDITHLNIYGCEFAQGEQGAQAVQTLEQLLGVSIAASTNLTGQGGDWVLEAGAPPIAALRVDAYKHTLHSAALEFAAGDGNPTGNGPVQSTTIRFRNNTDNPAGNTFATYVSPYTGNPVTATIAITNQQYTNHSLTGGHTQIGYNFSISSPVPFFPAMNGFGAPSNNFFTSHVTNTPGTGIDVVDNSGVSIWTGLEDLAGLPALRYWMNDIQITFSEPVNNPVLHFVGLGAGGDAGNANFASEFDVINSGGATISRLSGDTDFAVSGTYISNTNAAPTAAQPAVTHGSVLFTGTNISTIVLREYLHRASAIPWSGAGVNTPLTAEGFQIGISFLQQPATLTLTKISNGGTGTFSFSQTNLASNPASITTVTAGTPVSNAAVNVSTVGTAVTLTEAAVAGYTLTGFTCTDANSATTGNPASFGTFVAATRVGTVPAANVIAGSAITCTFTNTLTSVDLAVTKTNTSGLGPNDQTNDTLSRGQTTTYSIVVTNNGPQPVTGAVVTDPAVAGLTCTSLSCTGVACPSATPAASALQSGLALGTLAVGGGNAVTLNLNCTVN